MFWFIYVIGEKSIILYASILISTICVLFELIRNKQSIFDIFPTGILINIVMCVYSLFTGVFVAQSTQTLISAVKTYASYSVVCFDICYITKEEKSIDWLTNFLIFSGIISSIYIIFRGSAVLGYGYVLGPTQNPNKLGLIMNLGIMSIAYKSVKTKKHELTYFILAALFLYTIIGCGSRKSLLAALIICFFWLLTTIRQIWNKDNQLSRYIMFCLIALSAYAVYYYYSHVYIHTYSYNRMETFGNIEESHANQLRIIYYQRAFQYFLEHPVFGIGLAHFAIWNPNHGYAHSTYAEALADWGFIGCTIYFFPALAVGKRLINNLVFRIDTDITRLLCAMWIVELFLGIGQIWFYEIEHFIIWTLLYLCCDMTKAKKDKIPVIEGKYKYVKT